jgi:hypothetical protein
MPLPTIGRTCPRPLHAHGDRSAAGHPRGGARRRHRTEGVYRAFPCTLHTSRRAFLPRAARVSGPSAASRCPGPPVAAALSLRWRRTQPYRRAFAWMAVTLVLATLASRFRARGATGHRVEAESLFTVRPKGVCRWSSKRALCRDAAPQVNSARGVDAGGDRAGGRGLRRGHRRPRGARPRRRRAGLRFAPAFRAADAGGLSRAAPSLRRARRARDARALRRRVTSAGRCAPREGHAAAGERSQGRPSDARGSCAAPG